MREHLIPSVGTAHFNGPAGRPLTIMSEVAPFDGFGHGSISVLTDGDGWYSAEVVFDGNLSIAYAVNGYEDRLTAETDALHRARLDR